MSAGGGVGRVLRWLLAAQILIAGLMLSGDLMRALPDLGSPGSRAPGVGEPVQPGDQTRRYAPRRLLHELRPGVPSIADMPRRLTWEPAEIAGEPALRLYGEIRPGDAERLVAALALLSPAPAVVTLHSPGGSVADALVIGRALREAGAATSVEADAVCFSACPYVLAGGTERRVSAQASVGVHQHFFGENVILPAFLAVSDIQAGQADVMDFLDDMGVSPLLMARAMRTRPEDIYILLPHELTELALATELLD